MESTLSAEKESADAQIPDQKKQLWELELQVLQVFQDICERHELKYFAAGGTLLGAVRHQGFIPWDDDIDVQLPREDYEKFLQYAAEELPYPYILQYYKNEKYFRPYHCKIRKTDSPAHTVQEKLANPNTAEGVWIDVFCMDYVPDGKLAHKLKMTWLEFIRGIIKGEGITRRLYRKKGLKKLKARLSLPSLLWRLARPFTTLERLCEYYDRCAFSKEKTRRIAATCFEPGLKALTWDADLFNESVDLPFENITIKAPAAYEKALTTQYGDWKTPVEGTQYHSNIVMGPYKPRGKTASRPPRWALSVLQQTSGCEAERKDRKVYGILLAGGVGQRMGAAIPKQFLEINGAPIILYPLRIMQAHPDIDAIEVVCVEDYIPQLWELVKKERLNKVKWIVPGGASCQESTRNGLDGLKGTASDNDIVLIHMASYPLASAGIMTDCIRSAAVNGNGCAARPITYSVFFTEDRETAVESIDRDRLMLCTIPYAFRFGECAELYDQAFAAGKDLSGNVFTNTLYCSAGKKIFFTQDSETNIKVTTPGDISMMKAVLQVLHQKAYQKKDTEQ